MRGFFNQRGSEKTSQNRDTDLHGYAQNHTVFVCRRARIFSGMAVFYLTQRCCGERDARSEKTHGIENE